MSSLPQSLTVDTVERGLSALEFLQHKKRKYAHIVKYAYRSDLDAIVYTWDDYSVESIPVSTLAFLADTVVHQIRRQGVARC